MAGTTDVTIRLDAALKKQAEQLFAELGMNFTTAINIFLRQAVRQQKIPFVVSLKTPNAATLAAMAEAKRISRDPSEKSYTDFVQMMQALLVEE